MSSSSSPSVLQMMMMHPLVIIIYCWGGGGGGWGGRANNDRSKQTEHHPCWWPLFVRCWLLLWWCCSSIHPSIHPSITRHQAPYALLPCVGPPPPHLSSSNNDDDDDDGGGGWSISRTRAVRWKGWWARGLGVGVGEDYQFLHMWCIYMVWCSSSWSSWWWMDGMDIRAKTHWRYTVDHHHSLPLPLPP